MRILNSDTLLGHGNALGRSHAVQMLDAGMDMVDPYIGVHQLMRREESTLFVDGKLFELKEDPHSAPMELDLLSFKRVIVIGAAKGVQRCAKGLEEILGPYLTGGHVIGKHGDGIECETLGVTLAGHPVPDEWCIAGCQHIYEWIKDITEHDLVITVMGSGVSSLMTWPVEGVSIDDMHDLTQIMQIEKGALTDDLNILRGHLDRFKGGKIGRLLKDATVIHLATNDLGSNLTPGLRRPYKAVIQNSGGFPAFMPDRRTFADAIAVIDKYDAWDALPRSIRTYLQEADPADETMKWPEFEALGARVFSLTPKLQMVYPAVFRKAEELGYTPYMLAEHLTAEAAEAGRVMGAIALTVENMDQPFVAPCVLISSGETLVTVGKETGIGGRNQEFCIAAALTIAGSEKIVVGAVDTDGTDGPGGYIAPDAPDCLAGAVVDGYTAAQASKQNIDLFKAMKSHGTSAPLWALNCGISARHSISALDLRVIVIMK